MVIYKKIEHLIGIYVSSLTLVFGKFFCWICLKNLKAMLRIDYIPFLLSIMFLSCYYTLL